MAPRGLHAVPVAPDPQAAGALPSKWDGLPSDQPADPTDPGGSPAQDEVMPVPAAPSSDDKWAGLPVEKTELEKTFASVRDADPNHAAKVLALSQKMQQPPSFVAANLSLIQKAEAAPPSSLFGQVEAQYPGTAKFLTPPENMAVAHDDIHPLVAHENAIQHAAVRLGLLDQITTGAQAGWQGSSLGLQLRGKLPDLSLPQNAPLLESLSAGAAQMVSELPHMFAGGILGAGAGSIVAPGPGTVLGALAGPFAFPAALRTFLRQQYEQGDIMGAEHPVSRIGDVLKEATKQGVVGVLSGGAAAAASRVSSSALAPLAAELGTMTVAGKAVEGELPTGRDLLENAILMGGMHGVGHVIGAGFGHNEQNAQALTEAATLLKTRTSGDFYRAMGQAKEQAKLPERMPGTYEAFVGKQVDGTPFKNVYPPVAEIVNYFQSKGIDPKAAMEELGAGEAFEDAKKIGGTATVEIPYEAWLNRLSKEHYDALEPHVKFDPNDLTPAEEGAKREETAADVKAAADQKSADQQQADLDARNQAISDQAKSVRSRFEEQLRNSGLSEDQIKANAALHEAVISRLADRTGLDPEALAGRYQLTVDRKTDEQARLADRQQFDPDVLTRMRHEIDAGELQQGGLVTMNASDVPGSDVIGRYGRSSTFPDYFKGKGYAKKEAIKAIDKALLGGKLSDAQHKMVADLYNSSGHARPEEVTAAAQEPFLQKGAGPGVPQTSHPLPDRVDVVRVDRPLTGTRPPTSTLRKQLAAKFKDTAATNEHTGWDIDIPQKGIKETLKSVKTESDAVALEHVDQLIKSAVYERTGPDLEKDPNIKAVHYFYAPIQIGDQVHTYRMLVRETNMGQKFYDGMVSETAKPADRLVRAPSEEDEATRPGGPHTLSIDDFHGLINQERERTPLYQGDDVKQGRMQIKTVGSERTFHIDLLSAANESTLPHELGHYYLEVMRDITSGEDAPQALKDDFQKLLKWFGVEKAEDIKTEHHEQFARGFEKYLAEGNAPTPELEPVFNRFRRWITSVYRSLTKLNVELSPEIREVFDRMVASEDAIREAKERTGITDTVPEGAPPEQADKLRTLQERARDAAENTLIKQQMKEIQAGHKEFLARERERLTPEVTEQVRALPEYQDQAALQEKLASKKPVKQLAQEYLDGKLTEAREGAFEAHAELSGFSSGDEMAKHMLSLPSLEEEIAARVKAGMEPHADLKDSDRIRTEATKAVHSEKMAEVLALEREIYADLVKKKEVSAEATQRNRVEARVAAEEAKRQAKEILSKKPLDGSAKPSTYITAERNAAVKAAKALMRGDFEKATVAKREQMVNHALAAEAMRIQERADGLRTYLDEMRTKAKDFFKDQAVFDQAAALLHSLGFERSDFTPGQQEEALYEWVARMQQETNTVNIEPWVIAGTQLKPMGELTLSQLEDVTNAVKNIAQVGRFEDRAYKIADGAKLDDIARELIAATKTNGIEKQLASDREIGRDSSWQKGKGMASRYILSITKMETLLRKLQGFKDGGVWTRYFHDEVRSAADDESVRMRAAQADMKENWSVYSKAERKELIKPKAQVELGGKSVSKMDLVMMALHLGNDDNRTKLFNNRPVGVPESTPWSGEIVMRMLSRELKAKDWTFVQNIWDTINKLWPDTAKLHREMTGFEPTKVEATPFNVMTETGAMALRGGYFPLKEDSRASVRAGIRAEADNPLYSEQSPAWIAATKTGHTKARTGAQYSASLDPNVITNHIRDVIHDIAFRPTIVDMRRILARKDVQEAIRENVGIEGYSSMRDWVAAVAGGNTEASDIFSSMVRALRTRATTAAIFVRPSVFLQHLANPLLYPNAVDGFTAKDAWNAYIKRGAFSYVKDGLDAWPKMQAKKEWIFSLSPFMRDLHDSPDRSLAEAQKNFLGENSRIQTFAGHLIAGALETSALPMWEEAYNKALDQNKEQAEAVKYADTLVGRVQGSGRKYDAPPIQRGGEIGKALYMFSTFLNAEFNRWSAEAGKARIDGVEALPRMAGFLGSRLLFLSASGLLAGKFFGDDDHGLEKWLKEVVGFPMAMFPGFRDISTIALDQALGLHSFGYRPTPATAAIEAGIDSMKGGIGYLKGQTDGQKALESATKAASYLAPYPDQFNSWLWNAYDYVMHDMSPQPSDIYRRRPKKERNP